MKPQVRKFTKEDPCTKLEIWNCFRSQRGFLQIQIAVAESIIGENVPRFMIKEGRLEWVEEDHIEYYRLTDEGRKWLLRGFANYLKRHPKMKHKANFLPQNLM
ncbi:MAG: hypothetical protein KAJ73_00740 [Zetaproteobacteria bacterium]|nr:hypothetical protein [Zetaproteobacteria bacterium]